MKLTKTEKIWLALVIIFYAAYNMPFVPAYGSAQGTLIHGAITLIPLWVIVYVGMIKVFKARPLRKGSDPASEAVEKEGEDNA